MMDHSFEVGGRYRNEGGEYEVLAFEGEKMRVRYDDGLEMLLTIKFQSLIWQRIQDRESPSPPPPPKKKKKKSEATGGGQKKDIQPVFDLVNAVLETNFEAPYPADITDQLCLAIEANPDWLDRYNELITEFDSAARSGASTVNQAIARQVKSQTSMASTGKRGKAKSGLIKSFTLLG